MPDEVKWHSALEIELLDALADVVSQHLPGR